MPIFPIEGRANNFVATALLLGVFASCNVYTAELLQQHQGDGEGSGGSSDVSESSGVGARKPTSGGRSSAMGGEGSIDSATGIIVTTGGRSVSVSTGGVSSGGSGGVTSGSGGVMSGSGGASCTEPTGGGGSSTGGASTTVPTTSPFTCDINAGYECSSQSSLSIDNMEDGDGYSCPCKGWQGDWFTFAAGNNWQADVRPTPGKPFTMAPVSRTDASGAVVSSNAATFTGQTAANGVCGMGFLLKNTVIPDKKYVDASQYSKGSIRFFYKTEGILPNSGVLRVQLILMSTRDFADGGSCQPGDTPEMACNDHFAHVLEPSNNWAEARILLSTGAFSQIAGWGQPALFELTQLVGVQFIVSTEQKGAFKVTVDDLAFSMP